MISLIHCYVFILSLKLEVNSICCVYHGGLGEKFKGWGLLKETVGFALSGNLLLDVTGKIGKAFNVMQYLSKHPIKIRPNQSLLAERGLCYSFTPTLQKVHTTDVQHVHLQGGKKSSLQGLLLFKLPFFFTLRSCEFNSFHCTTDQKFMFQVKFVASLNFMTT